MLISSIPKPDPLPRMITEKKGNLNGNKSELKSSYQNINFDINSSKNKGKEIDIISDKYKGGEIDIVSDKYKGRDTQRLIERAPGHYVLEA